MRWRTGCSVPTARATDRPKSSSSGRRPGASAWSRLAQAGHPITVDSMWTRLVAGAAAHDINNLAQGLSNLLALATGPRATPEALGRYASLARDGLKDLQRLSADLRAVAHSQDEAQLGP